MRDHEHGLSRVEAQGVREEGLDARRERVERLRVLRAEAFACLPPAMTLGKVALDLLRGEAFPRPEATLAKTSIEVHVGTELVREDFRRLAGSLQIAREIGKCIACQVGSLLQLAYAF